MERDTHLPEGQNVNPEKKQLSLATNANLLDALKTSSFLNLQFDDELEQGKIEEVKGKVKNCISYFNNTTVSGEESIPETLDGEQVTILIKCLNLLKEMGAIYANDVNSYLTNRNYSKYTINSAREVINSRDDKWHIKEEPNYVNYEDAARCCELVYEYLDASSLDDYKTVNKRKNKNNI